MGLTPAISNELNQPIFLAHANDRSGRLFVVESTDKIRIIKGNTLLSRPFLDLSDRVHHRTSLFSIAFSPGFKTNHLFYVNYLRKLDRATVISRFTVGSDPDVADAVSEQMLIKLPWSGPGSLVFGREGYLFAGLGDAGSRLGLTSPELPQDAATCVGKLLRLEVDNLDPVYSVPAGNPYIGSRNAAPEIWALGLRLSWPFSVDRLTGDLYLPDAGWNWGEINVRVYGSPGGQNYGWPHLEGPGGQSPPPGVDPSSLVTPAFYYRGGQPSGGAVYHGARNPRMYGIYYFGDAYSGGVYALARTGTNWHHAFVAGTQLSISCLGEDDEGELYVGDYRSGSIFRLESSAKSAPPVFESYYDSIFTNVVQITCPTPGTVIHYTRDGRDPTEVDRAVLSGEALLLVKGTITKLRAFRVDLQPSEVTARAFSIFSPPRAAQPAFTPWGIALEITNGTRVTIACATIGADIHYTLDGTIPTRQSPLYLTPLQINGNTMIRAIALAEGYEDSWVAEAFYRLALVATPWVDDSGGGMAGAETFSLGCETPGATIYYTLDGTEPDESSARYGQPFTIEPGTTLKAKAFAEGYGPGGTLTVPYSSLHVATPVFDPPSGPLYFATNVTISCATPGAIIRYRVDMPDENETELSPESPVYSAPVLLAPNTVVRA